MNELENRYGEIYKEYKNLSPVIKDNIDIVELFVEAEKYLGSLSGHIPYVVEIVVDFYDELSPEGLLYDRSDYCQAISRALSEGEISLQDLDDMYLEDIATCCEEGGWIQRAKHEWTVNKFLTAYNEYCIKVFNKVYKLENIKQLLLFETPSENGKNKYRTCGNVEDKTFEYYKDDRVIHEEKFQTLSDMSERLKNTSFEYWLFDYLNNAK